MLGYVKTSAIFLHDSYNGNQWSVFDKRADDNVDSIFFPYLTKN
jgi:hypothetical protein